MIPGAEYHGHHRCTFTVWAPHARNIEVHLLGTHARFVPLDPGDFGWWQKQIESVPPGTDYTIRIDGARERPDPASRFQPDTVHGPSRVIDHAAFAWPDTAWRNPPLKDYIIYELHIGTFTPEGTFEAVIPRLPELRDLGITAVEIMPVAQFPGTRNWGYDGVHPWAVQNSYGGPEGLKKLVAAAHQNGLAVILDVVYNHLGPEGNYLREFGPYFTEHYKTPWGDAINFDQSFCDPVRDYFIRNALYWFREYRMDALRLDALHAITDNGAVHFFTELSQTVDTLSRRLRRPLYLIGESDLNDVSLIRPRSAHGHGLHAQWSDDFHHSVHALLTGECIGYYQDFGSVEDLGRALRRGWVYTGQYSRFRKRRHGNDPGLRPGEQFVVCIQNHDQVGNRMKGDRLGSLVDFESLKTAAGVLLLSPFVPLIFMGDEYAEDAPFQYFVSLGDEDLIRAVRQGRKKEFEAFDWNPAECPDPQSPQTFRCSMLDWSLQKSSRHRVLRAFYRRLIELRKSVPIVHRRGMRIRALPAKNILTWRRSFADRHWLCLVNFDTAPQKYRLVPRRSWTRILDSAEMQWLGPGSTLPEKIDTDGVLNLPSRALVLYESMYIPDRSIT